MGETNKRVQHFHHNLKLLGRVAERLGPGEEGAAVVPNRLKDGWRRGLPHSRGGGIIHYQKTTGYFLKWDKLLARKGGAKGTTVHLMGV